MGPDCIKFDFRHRPRWGAYSAPIDPLAAFKGTDKMGREGYSSQTSKPNFVHDLAIALLSGHTHTHTQTHSTDCLTRTTAEAVAAGAR